MATVYDVANYYLANTKGMTNKKLQKMVFYAYAWHLTLSNDNVDELDTRLFENKFEAWVHGAVYPELYDMYKKYGSSEIPVYDGEFFLFSPDEFNILEQVNDLYGKYNGNQLESINHHEAPWRKARNGLAWYEPSHNLIKDRDIFEYHIREAEEY